MPDGDQLRGGSDVWPVWLAPAGALREINEQSDLARLNAGATPPYDVRPFTRTEWGCLLTGIGLTVCAGCTLTFGVVAMAEGHTETLLLLAAAHLPWSALKARLSRMAREAKTEEGVTGTVDGQEYPRPPHAFHASRLTRCRETGVDLNEGRFLGWEECAGYRFEGDGDGRFFSVTLTLRPRPPRPPQPAGFRGMARRFRAIAPELLPALLLPMPLVLSVAALFYGYAHFGPRVDVRAALFTALAHLIVAGAAVFSHRQTKPDAATPEEVRLVFDGQFVSATAVLNRLDRYLG